MTEQRPEGYRVRAQDRPGVADHAEPIESADTARRIGPVTVNTTVAGGSAAVVSAAIVRLVDDIWYGGGAINVDSAYIGLIGLVVTGVSVLVTGWLTRGRPLNR